MKQVIAVLGALILCGVAAKGCSREWEATIPTALASTTGVSSDRAGITAAVKAGRLPAASAIFVRDRG